MLAWLPMWYLGIAALILYTSHNSQAISSVGELLVDTDIEKKCAICFAEVCLVLVERRTVNPSDEY